MSKDCINDIKIAVTGIEQKSIFSNADSDSQLKEACVRYLRSEGYTVVSPRSFTRKMKDTKDLVVYFYSLLNSKHPDLYMTTYNKSKDLSIAKKFVEGRMSLTGYDKNYALNECGEIIKTVIDNEEVFNFTNVPSFYIFGQANMAWVTERALRIMNVKLKEEEEARGEVLRSKMIESQDPSEMGFGDLDEILSKMEAVNGKEER